MKRELSPVLKQKLKRTFKTLNTEVPSINSGGCGVFAVSLTKILRKLGYDARIIGLNMKRYYSFDDGDKENMITSHNLSIKNAMKHNSSSNATKSHYVVRVGNTYIDCTNIKKCNSLKMRLKYDNYKTFSYRIILGNVPVSILAYLNKDPFVWNPYYHRSNNQKIDKILKTNLL
jgi:hypothetical protein